MKKLLLRGVIILGLIGLLDALYLSYEHYAGVIPPCAEVGIIDCGTVLRSEYAVVFGIPLAVLGVGHYAAFLTIASVVLLGGARWAIFILLLQSLMGFIASGYFVFLQLVVLQAICLYCMVSAATSTFIFIFVQSIYYRDYRMGFIDFMAVFYKRIIKPIFFRLEPEVIHDIKTRQGELLGSVSIIRKAIGYVFAPSYLILKQNIHNIEFQSPIGLAAGFDYEVRLTEILPSLGFGFGSIGTITNHPYEGNPRPMLGRLPQSQSLMVNKGFKNDGADAVIQKLRSRAFLYPVGVSIGVTNSSEPMTVKETIQDIITTFQKFEKSKLGYAYYELNISCPNLKTHVSFYETKNLQELLRAVDKLKIKRPIFVKMPIELTNAETRAILDVIADHSPKGVIIGNLWKKRQHPKLVPSEVEKFTVGAFSGKPTFERSNELISLVYKQYKKRFVIIGCGGVFSAEDAYEKILRGASLVQLITGMIYMGPQLIAQINDGLAELLKRDGYTHISQAVGKTKHTQSYLKTSRLYSSN